MRKRDRTIEELTQGAPKRRLNPPKAASVFHSFKVLETERDAWKDISEALGCTQVELYRQAIRHFRNSLSSTGRG